MVIINRIPFFIWVIVAIAALLMAITKLLGISDVVTFVKHRDVYAMAVAAVGVIILAVQIHAQAKESRIANEYLNQPDFDFTKFCEGEPRSEDFWMPHKCGEENNLNRCNDVHWFDVHHRGKLPARDISIGLFHSKETSINNEKRWLKKEVLYPDDTMQFKLPPYSIPFDYYNKNGNGDFWILMSYRSPYSNVRYKRRYRMDYTPDFNWKKPEINDWTEKISVFDVALENMRDSQSIGVRDILKSRFSRLMRVLTNKKEVSFDEWLNDF